MSISYVESGRRNQKERTRSALVAAARELLAEGEGTPSVEAVAEAASVSRATAYRYFPNQDALLLAAHPEVEAESLLSSDPSPDPAVRLDEVVTRLAKIFLDAEQSYRVMLRLSLEQDTKDRGELALRKGRRYLWIRDALEPVRHRMSPAEFDRLVHGVSITAGIEALVTLVDLAGLSRDRAVEVMRWSARALLRESLADARRPAPSDL